MPEPSHCQNCQAALEGPFCHICGQRDADLRVAIWRLVLQLLAETFEADGRLVRTLPRFFLRPGALVRSFVMGQRARYTSPVRLLVFALAMGFLCLGFGANRSLDAVADALEDRPFTVEAGVAHISPEGQRGFSISVREGTEFERRLHRLDGMNQRQAARLLLGNALDAAPTILLLLIPALTLLLELLYPRYLVIEHLLLATVLHAQGLILVGLSVVLGVSWLQGVLLVWLNAQLFMSLRDVYQQSWLRTLLKGLVVIASYWILILAAMIGTLLMMLYSL